MASPARWTLAATILGSGMTFLDATVVNVALPALQADLHASMADLQWVIEAYALLLGALILIGGSLGDQFGRRRVFLAGTLFFTLASILCGIAPSPRLLIAGRALQGLGAAFMVPGSLAIVSTTFAGAERGRAIGTWSGFTSITAAIGPLVGGWMIEHISWRAVFFLNVPLAIVVMAIAVTYIEESRDPSRSSRVDLAGGLLAVLALGGPVFALIEWPSLGGAHPLAVGSLIVGAVSLVLLVGVERRLAQPMIPLALFRSATFTLANVLTLLLYAAIGVILFLVPLNLIQVQRYTPPQAGAALLPLPIILFVFSRWSGGLVARVGSRLPLTLGPAVAALGFTLYAVPGVGGSYWTTFFPAVIVLGLGLVVTVAPLTTTVMGAVEEAHAGVASGFNNAVARVASLVAIAAFGVVFTHGFSARVGPPLDRMAFAQPVQGAIARELPKMAGADLEAIAALSPADRAAVRRTIDEAFVGAFRTVMLGAAALALAAAGVGAAIR